MITFLKTRKTLIKLSFIPQILWVGLHWKIEIREMLLIKWKTYQFYVCLIPCFPLIIAHKKLI